MMLIPPMICGPLATLVADPGLIVQFQRPGRLWWLLVPLVVVLGYVGLSARRTPVRRPSRIDLRRILPRDKAWKRHLAVLCSVASMASLVLAFAQPQAFREEPRDRATVVITMDVSRSMIATDVQPSRLSAAKSAAKSFLTELPERFNVALVKFAASAQLVVPPTTDRGTVSTAIDNLQVLPSTAIGEGIYSSLDALKLAPDDPSHPGTKPPHGGGAAVRRCHQCRQTLPAGRPAGPAGERPGVHDRLRHHARLRLRGGRRQPVPVNHHELAAIAKASGGEKFSAESLGQLTDVYKSIAKAVGQEKVYAEVTDRYVGYGLLLAVLVSLGVVSLAARWP